MATNNFSTKSHSGATNVILDVSIPESFVKTYSMFLGGKGRRTDMLLETTLRWLKVIEEECCAMATSKDTKDEERGVMAWFRRSRKAKDHKRRIGALLDKITEWVTKTLSYYSGHNVNVVMSTYSLTA